jgi:hypothetical protein
MVLAGGVVALVAIAGLTSNRDPASMGILASVMLVLLVCLLLFHALNVRVSQEHITLRFGIGLIRKRFAVGDLEKATVVRNRWYYGWGIRLLRRGWLYNVSGFSAVEIQLRSGQINRIGTDEPDALLRAIELAIRSRTEKRGPAEG